MKENEYQCAHCGGIFEPEPDWTEDKRWAEHESNFPGESHETVEVVCEDCYQAMIRVEPPPGMKS